MQLCHRSLALPCAHRGGRHSFCVTGGQPQKPPPPSPFVPSAAKGGALCLRAVPAPAQPQNFGSGARRGKGFVWCRIPLARMGRKVSISHTTPSLPVIRHALSRAHHRVSPSQLSCYAKAERPGGSVGGVCRGPTPALLAPSRRALGAVAGRFFNLRLCM